MSFRCTEIQSLTLLMPRDLSHQLASNDASLSLVISEAIVKFAKALLNFLFFKYEILKLDNHIMAESSKKIFPLHDDLTVNANSHVINTSIRFRHSILSENQYPSLIGIVERLQSRTEFSVEVRLIWWKRQFQFSIRFVSCLKTLKITSQMHWRLKKHKRNNCEITGLNFKQLAKF